MILINKYEDQNVDMLIILTNFIKVYITNSSSSSWNVVHASNMKVEGNNLEYLQAEFKLSTLYVFFNVKNVQDDSTSLFV